MHQYKPNQAMPQTQQSQHKTQQCGKQVIKKGKMWEIVEKSVFI